MIRLTTNQSIGTFLILLSLGTFFALRAMEQQHQRFELIFNFKPHYEDGRPMTPADVKRLEVWRIDENGILKVDTFNPDPSIGSTYKVKLGSGCYLVRTVSGKGEASTPSDAYCTPNIEPIQYAKSLFMKRPQ